MAGAGPQARELVCFVQVDPSFYVVLDAITELQDAKRLEAVGTVRVGNAGLRSKNNDEEYRRDYDFSRTLGGVLRRFMLKATGLIQYYKPKCTSDKANLNNGYFIKSKLLTVPNRDPDEGKDKKTRDKTVGRRQAQEVSGNFDRLYPHILIEKKLEDAELDKEVSFPGMMLIMDIDVKNPDHPRIIKLHQINTSVKFTKGADNVIKCPKPSVRNSVKRVLDGKDGPAFQELMVMIKKHLGIVRQRDAADPQPKVKADPDAPQPKVKAYPDAPQSEDEDEKEEKDPAKLLGKLRQLRV